MQQQAGILLYRFRFLFASTLVLAFLLFVSVLVTDLGANTVLDAKTHPTASVLNTSLPSSPNAVSVAGSALAVGTQRTLLSMGTSLYKTCRSVTTVAARIGTATAHDSAVAIRGVGHAAVLVGRGFGGATMFALRTTGGAMVFAVRLPGHVVGTITSKHSVSAIIRPAEQDNTTVPVINAETSTAVLAQFNAAQQQEIIKLQAAQVAANRALDGRIVAGDPSHGGYPTKWDAIRQDSTLDSWGMYNRECVSYAAWKVYQTYGDMPYWGGVGNANEWIGDARRAGIPTSSVPKVHSVAISMHGYYGHAMWVEAVSGNMVYVSQYNYDLHGRYSEMWVNASRFTYIYFR